MLPDVYQKVKHLLSEAARQVICQEGVYAYYEEPKFYGTSLMPDGACTFLIYNDQGIAKCGIEKAFELGLTDFQKPVSCHLYPIRTEENELTGFAAMNYDRWDICSDACTLGKELKIPLFKFVKSAIIRKYGQQFFEEMESYYERYQSSEAQ